MTYFLSLLVALAVAGTGCLLRRRSLAWGNGLILLGCVGCIAAIAWQVRTTLAPADAKVPNRAHTAVGFCLATQTQRDISGQRGTVVLVMPPSSALDSETAETYANTFRGPLLRGHPELDVQIATLEAPAKEAKAGTIPAAAFKRVISKFPGALAFVCFAGIPTDFGNLFPTDGPAAPPVFVFDAHGTTNWVQPLLHHRIRSVIVPRPDVEPGKASSITGLPGEVFGQLYYLATPETAEQVAAKLAATPAPKPR
jgi:hypothetical protein